MTETKPLDARQTIIAVMKSVEGVAKRGRNEQQSYNFRGIDAVLNAVGPELRKHGGFLKSNILTADHTTGVTSKGSQVNIARLHVQYSFFGEVGEPLVGDVVAEAFDTSDKATAKALSVALRSYLIQLLCLPTDEKDPDAEYIEATPNTQPVVEITPERMLKQKIQLYFEGQPRSAIQNALFDMTGKTENWTVEELETFLNVLENKIDPA
jgi:hypothetical protein